MDFTFSDEQEELRRTVRRFFEDKSAPAEVRRLMETDDGYDATFWKQAAHELGLQGIHIPEEYGGQGATFVELGIVLEEMGRLLVCAPYLASVGLAANAILNAGSEDARRALLPGIASGETIAAFAFAEPEGRWTTDSIALRASRDGSSWRLSGSKMFVVDGASATLIVVAARTDDGLGLFTVSGDAAGLTRTALTPIDMTRKQARLDFDHVVAEPLATGDAATRAMTTTLDQAAVCLAAEATGGAQRCLEMAVEYAKNRVQFGRPIGQFQAVKHMCADMLLDVESAKTAVYYALWAAAGNQDELGVVAPLAKSFCTEAFFRAASANIQVHGGIGFTWEHDAHLYFRRAKSSELMFGDAPYHRELLATRLGI